MRRTVMNGKQDGRLLPGAEYGRQQGCHRLVAVLLTQKKLLLKAVCAESIISYNTLCVPFPKIDISGVEINLSYYLQLFNADCSR